MRNNATRCIGSGGYELGPDITGSNRADLDYVLLSNLVDPSADGRQSST